MYSDGLPYATTPIRWAQQVVVLPKSSAMVVFFWLHSDFLKKDAHSSPSRDGRSSQYFLYPWFIRHKRISKIGPRVTITTSDDDDRIVRCTVDVR